MGITPKQHPVPYSITLLEQTQKRFISKFLKDTKSVDPWADYSEFTGTFEKLLKDQLDQARPANNRPAKFTPKPKTETPKSESETTLEPETPKENTQVAQPAKPRGIPQKNQVHSVEKVLLGPQRKNPHRKKKNLELNERESGEWKMMTMIINQHQKTLNQHLPNKNRALMFLFERSIFLMNQILIVKMKKRNRKAKKDFSVDIFLH